MLDTAPDAFITLDRDGDHPAWNTAAERLFGWTAAEAIGKPMRELIFPAEAVSATTSAARELIDGDAPVATRALRGRARAPRRDALPGRGDRLEGRGRRRGRSSSGFIRDVTERARRQDEREALLREQAARAEAERVAEMVSGMQLLVDAALAHRTPRRHPRATWSTRVRGVLGADAATIYLADEGERLSTRLGRRPRRRRPEPIAFGEGFAGRVAQARAAARPRPAAGELADPRCAT